MKLLFRLLSQNVSIWQTIAFAVANLVGAFIILAGWQVLRDVNQVFDETDSFLSSNYLVISKAVNAGTTLSTFLGGRPAFSDDEISEFESQPGVKSVGRFSAAQFEVSGVIDIQGMSLSSQMFLEAVPDEYLDTQNDGIWRASADDDFVPIVLPKTYLNLYNFGFASSRGLPQVADDIVRKFPLQLVVSGNGLSKRYTARVVDFSDRLNTILVPAQFLAEANARFATTTDACPSRIIVKASTRDLSTSLLDFIESHDYQIEGLSEESLRLQTLIRGIVWAIIGMGGVVTLLACFLLIVSINLLIEKDRDRLRNLFYLGYPAKTIAIPYALMACGLDLFTCLGAAVSVTLAYPLVSQFLSTLLAEYEVSSIGGVWLLAVIMAILFFGIHLFNIRRKILISK